MKSLNKSLDAGGLTHYVTSPAKCKKRLQLNMLVSVTLLFCFVGVIRFCPAPQWVKQRDETPHNHFLFAYDHHPSNIQRIIITPRNTSISIEENMSVGQVEENESKTRRDDDNEEEEQGLDSHGQERSSTGQQQREQQQQTIVQQIDSTSNSNVVDDGDDDDDEDNNGKVINGTTNAEVGMGAVVLDDAHNNGSGDSDTTVKLVDSGNGNERNDKEEEPAAVGCGEDDDGDGGDINIMTAGDTTTTNEANSSAAAFVSESLLRVPEQTQRPQRHQRLTQLPGAFAVRRSRNNAGRDGEEEESTIVTNTTLQTPPQNALSNPDGDRSTVVDGVEIVDMEDMEAEFRSRIIANATTALAVQVVVDDDNNNNDGNNNDKNGNDRPMGERDSNNMESNTLSSKRNVTGILLLICFVLILIVIIVIVVIILLRNSNNHRDKNNTIGDVGGSGNENKVGPTSPPASTIPLTDYEYLLDILSPISGREKLIDETTSQYRAMNWLLEDDPASYDMQTTNSRALVERYIIAHFYFSTSSTHLKGGKAWKRNLNFLSELSICNWHGSSDNVGIFCYDDSPFVQTVNFIRNGLDGTIPSELFSLSLLRYLSIEEEYGIQGTIPNELFQNNELPFLKYVRISSTNVGGTIPEPTNKNGIVDINLPNNNLSGTIPFETMISNYHSSLETIDIADNWGLVGVLPENLGDMTKLTTFSI